MIIDRAPLVERSRTREEKSCMSREIVLGQIAGLRLVAMPSAMVASALLWLVLGAIGAAMLGLPAGLALLGAAIAVMAHWASEIGHQLGHAWVAKRTGYPMIGIRLWGALSTALYPDDEPGLPGAVHIRRAVGGPAASLILAAAFALAVLALWPWRGLLWYLAIFVCLDNLLVLGLGALLPLGFTDGSTLLYWWGRR
jgi:hypothetical protein